MGIFDMMAKIRSFWIVGCLFLFSFGKTHAQVALNFTMTDTKGKEWNLYEELLKGKTVVLDFFFADCTPCQRLTPAMALLYDSLSKDSVLVLGISDRDLDIRLDKFETDFGVTYPSCGVQVAEIPLQTCIRAFLISPVGHCTRLFVPMVK